MSAVTAPSAARSPAQRLGGLLVERPIVVLGVLLVVLVALTEITNSGAVNTGYLRATIQVSAILAILAAGQTLVMLTGGIDLSVATTLTAAAYVTSANGSRGAFPAIVAGLVVGLVIGLVNGFGVAICRVQPLIMTLGTSAVTIGSLTVYSQQGVSGTPVVPDVVHSLGSGTFLGGIPYDLLVWLPLAVLIVAGLRSSGYGRMLYAVGDNPEACRLAGVRVWQVQLATYVLCGFLAGLSGLILVGYTNAADLQIGDSYLLPSVAAVVIGGTSIFGGLGGYTGTIMGALILTVLGTLLTLLNAAESLRQILYGLIILLLAWAYTRVTGAADS
jgi:ribose transport system permease protein